VVAAFGRKSGFWSIPEWLHQVDEETLDLFSQSSVHGRLLPTISNVGHRRFDASDDLAMSKCRKKRAVT
jgi:hypothetical protein